jgi:hypothetical protein
MTHRNDILSTIEEALGFTETSLIVRTAAAIVEMRGPLKFKAGEEWATVGEESGSHVHLKMQNCETLLYTPSNNTNAALEVRTADGEVVCRVSFRGTNPSQADRYDPERAANVRARFARLGKEAGA